MLNTISSKYKLENSKSKLNFEESKESQKNPENIKIINSQNIFNECDIPELFNEEEEDFKIDNNKQKSNNNIILNKNINNNDNNKFIENKPNLKSNSKNEIGLIQKEKTLKIRPQKKEDFSQKEKDLILDTLNLFIDDFQEDEKNISINNNIIIKPNSLKQKDKDKDKEKENIILSKDYSLLSKRDKDSINNKMVKSLTQISDVSSLESKSEIEFKYIEQINQIIYNNKNISINVKFKIKCHVDFFDIGKRNYYMGCSICTKTFKNKQKLCCIGGHELPLYYFYVIMRDLSGRCKVFFHNKVGQKFMGMPAEKFKKMVEDDTPVGRIIFEEYKNDFYENEFIITLQFFDDHKGKFKRYEATSVDRITKKDRYMMIEKLKKILK